MKIVVILAHLDNNRLEKGPSVATFTTSPREKWREHERCCRGRCRPPRHPFALVKVHRAAVDENFAAVVDLNGVLLAPRDVDARQLKEVVVVDLKLVAIGHVKARVGHGVSKRLAIRVQTEVLFAHLTSDERHGANLGERPINFKEDHAGVLVVGDHLGAGVATRDLLLKVKCVVGGVLDVGTLRADAKFLHCHPVNTPIALGSDLHVGTWGMRSRSFPAVNQFPPRQSFGDLGKTHRGFE